MKQRARVRKGKKIGKKIARIRAVADEGRGSRNRDWMAEIGELYKPIKRPVTLRLDADVVAWFKKQGRGYQTRINRALRAVMMEERKGGSGE
jgi:uncharacterized protein (DUF4415 family)